MTTGDSHGAGTEGEGALVERVFNAPRRLVWEAWTDPEHFRRWYGPASMTTHTCEIDFRVGGRYLFGMRSGEGWEYWNAGVYQEIVAPERFVATQVLADSEGNTVTPAHYGLPDSMPAETLLSVVLEDLGDGRTKLTLRQLGFPAGPMADGAAGGWNEAFDKLDAIFATA